MLLCIDLAAPGPSLPFLQTPPGYLANPPEFSIPVTHFPNSFGVQLWSQGGRGSICETSEAIWGEGGRCPQGPPQMDPETIFGISKLCPPTNPHWWPMKSDHNRQIMPILWKVCNKLYYAPANSAISLTTHLNFVNLPYKYTCYWGTFSNK